MKNRAILYDATEYKDIRDLLNDATKKFGSKDAFIIKRKNGDEINYEHISYNKVREDVDYLGTALMDLGLKDKRIAIIANNRYEWCLAYLVTLCGLGIVVPLDRALPTGEIESLLQRSHADAVIFEEQYNEVMMNIKQDKDNNVKYFISMDEKDDTKFLSLEKLIEKGKKLLKQGNKEYKNAKIDRDVMSIILFTSGTTSVSKAVMLSQKNIVSNIDSLHAMIRIYPEDTNLAFLPLHHTFGSTALLLFMSNGTTNVFCDGLRYIQKNLQEYQVTIFVCVPLLLEAMNKKIMKEIEKQGKTKVTKVAKVICNFLLKFGIDIRRKVFKSVIDSLGGKLRLIVSGAAGLDKTVAKNFNSLGIRTIQGYGLTETSPVLAAENDKYIRYGSIGVPLKNIEIKIDSPNEEGVGELVAKGPNVMLGYYENEEATKKVLIDGWFHTGDLGYYDKDGFIFITGRKKNVIVMKNGKNIYPEEVELLIAKLPYVSENMVFAVPTKDDDLDLAVKIVYNKEYVEEKYGKISEEELKNIIWEDIKKINKTMPPYKYIRKLIITDEPMVKTTTQKVKRFEEMKKLEEIDKN